MSDTSINNEISINGETYIKKSAQPSMAVELNGMRCCIVRTYSAGVFVGYVKARDGREVTLVKARRLWRWTGAASLSELAIRGTSNPGGCKFPAAVPEVVLTEAIEIIPCTHDAIESICNVPEWSAHDE